MPEFKKSTIREYFESIVIAVILALFVRTWVVQACRPARRGGPAAFAPLDHSVSVPIFSTARNASCGISTVPTRFMRFLPSFCFSSS